MALTPELARLRRRLNGLGYKARTSGQDRLLEELDELDDVVGLEQLQESHVASVTKMTSPGDGVCNCCGRAY